MSRASLLNSNEPAFAFEHAMAHRNALGIMSPLDRFSAVPYFIDPPQNIGTPASMWHLNHQQAHGDASNNLPSYFGADVIGLHLGAILREYDLNDPRQRKLWEFDNWIEHLIGGNTITPNVQFPPPAPQWQFPFW